jgi:glyoxylase-like metal-dependent hydrolase (beta-lactamase superfamily II)
VARTILGRPLFWGGAYLVDGLLVDCGPPATAPEVLRFLEGRPLEGLVLTHHHEDHMGAAPLLAARRGLEPRIHPLGAPLLEKGFPQELYRTLTWGRRGRVRPGLLGDAVQSRTLRFEVLSTPGHSQDHICLWQPDRGWLFTGDLFLAERLKYLRSDEELPALITSLETVSRLPLREVFCAHRGPVRDGPAALRRKAEGLRALHERVGDLLDQGLPESEVARRAVGREGLLTWLSGGRFSARNFVRAVVRGRGRGA